MARRHVSVNASSRRSAYGLTCRSGGVPSSRTDRVSNMLRIVSDVELGERLPQLIFPGTCRPRTGRWPGRLRCSGRGLPGDRCRDGSYTRPTSRGSRQTGRSQRRNGPGMRSWPRRVTFGWRTRSCPSSASEPSPTPRTPEGARRGRRYVAKYATKSSDAKGALDHRLRTADEIAGLDVNDHLRRFVSTALDPRAVDVRRLETVVSADNTASIRLLSRVRRAQVHPPGGDM